MGGSLKTLCLRMEQEGFCKCESSERGCWILSFSNLPR